MKSLFLVIPNQEFANDFRNPNSPAIYFTQGVRQPIAVFLLEYTGDGAYPFMYRTSSGDASLIATATLLSSSSSPSTLTVPVVLTPIRNGFKGVLALDTLEIATLLGNVGGAYAPRPSVEVIFSLEVVDADGETVESFQSKVTLRLAPASATAPTPVTQLSGVSDDLTVTAAGTTDLVPGHAFIQWFQKVTATAGAGAYTHKLTLDSFGALEGATYRVEIDIPASSNPLIEIYDENTSGAPLESIPGDSDNATKYRFEAVFQDGHWIKDNGEFI
jgi:hypothetical protein